MPYAWFEPSKGPEDIPGVRLAYLQHIEDHYNECIRDATSKKDTARVGRLIKSWQGYIDRGQKFFTPDFGWWDSEEAYHEGRSGFGGVTKESVEANNPSLVIVPSRNVAEALLKAHPGLCLPVSEEHLETLLERLG